MFKRILLTVFAIAAVGYLQTYADDIIEFEIIIPSYNNAQWYMQNLHSAVNQDYPLFHVTYIDDCSTDGTGALVDEYVQQNNLQTRVTVIHNKQRRGAMANWYEAISACPDHKVVVNLDGDDMLAHRSVLALLAHVYQQYDVWLTYGQFGLWPQGGRGWCEKMPEHIVKNNAFRDYNPMPSHLRTFYAWLFKKIKKEDFMHEGDFFTITCDQAMMFPMMEMAGERHAFINQIVYWYNTMNSTSDHVADNGRLQSSISRVIRTKERYQRLEKPEVALRLDKPLYSN